MKITLSLLTAALLLSTIAFAAAPNAVEGNTYCRTVERDGMFGQPKGKASHCVAFKNGFMNDNANTFFGNPPEVVAYKLVNNQILTRNKQTAKVQVSYVVKGDQIENSAGAVLVKQ